MENLDQSPLLIAGPSGVGKTHLAGLLFAQYNDFGWLLSTTDRAARPTDVPGRDYDIVDTTQYERIRAAQDFFMDNNFFGANYGFRRSDLARILAAGKRPLALVYTPVVHQFMAAYPDTHALFLEPDPNVGDELLAQRMRDRGDAEKNIEGRIRGRREELEAFERQRHLFKDVVRIVDNTSVQEAIQRIEARYQLKKVLK